MALTYTTDIKGIPGDTSATITSNALSVSSGNFITVAWVASDNLSIDVSSPTNNGSAITWTQHVKTNTADNEKVVLWSGIAGATPPTTVSVTATGTNASSHSKALFVAVHTGQHGTTPIPSGNIFSGVGSTDISQSITPTSSGSAIWLFLADWNATNSFAAITNCVLVGTYHLNSYHTVAAVRPTTQPRADANAFTIGETDTSGKIAWIAWEVQAASSSSQTVTQSSRFDNANNFFSGTVSKQSAKSVSQSARFDNTSSFFGGTLTQQALNISQSARFDNISSFFGGTVTKPIAVLQAARFDNISSFFGGTVTKPIAVLQVARFNNTNNFFGGTVSKQSAQAITQITRFDNINNFFGGTVSNVTGSQNVTQSSRFDNTNNFFGGTITKQSAKNISQSARFDNTNNFFGGTVTKPIPIVQNVRFDNTNNFFGGTIAKQTALSITQIARFNNTNNFFGGTVTKQSSKSVVQIARLDNLNNFFAGTVSKQTNKTITQTERFDNANRFFGGVVGDPPEGHTIPYNTAVLLNNTIGLIKSGRVL